MKEVIVCPFYKRKKFLSLFCEGGEFKFPDNKAQKEFKSDFCTNIKNWHNCSVACMLENYYERKDV